MTKPISPKKRIKTTRQEIYYHQCPECDMEISGRGIKVFHNNWKRHMKFKHKVKK